MRPATRAVHAGAPRDGSAPLADPIYVATTYAWETLEERPQYEYSRDGHPNRTFLQDGIASLEGGQFAVAYGSGVAAIAAAVGLAQCGEHVLIATDIYGGTHELATWLLPRHGVEVGWFNALDASSLAQAAKPNTRLVIFESPTNPTLRIADIAAICAEARRLGIVSVFDNTFATPFLQLPLELGADMVVHSTTKYMGGHSDVLGGAAVTNDPDLHAHLHRYARVAGGVPGPFECWLVTRGLRSLSPRMQRHCENAQRVAEFLLEHPRVRRVNYPGLPDHPGHDLAKRQMSGFGGMLSFEVDGSQEETMAVARSCRIFKTAASLGGVESLISYPVRLSHMGMSEAEWQTAGITPQLLRVSVGLEDAEDLVEDLDQALARTSTY
jgi:cystathionine beta-lyase/cystathionine gamma-synthase